MNKINAPITRLLPAVSPSAGCPLVVRAGDFLELGESLRVALNVAEIALELADNAGASPRRIWRLRQVIEGLRR